LPEKHSRRNFFKKIAITGAGAGALGALADSFFLPKILATPDTITIRPNSLISEVSYIIFKDGNTIKARNGKTGQIQYSGTNAAAVIQNVFNTIKDNGGLVFFKAGVYDITGNDLTVYTKVCKPIFIKGESARTTEIRSDRVNYLYLDGTGFETSKRYNMFFMSDILLSLALKTKNTLGKAWYGDFNNVTVSLSWDTQQSDKYGVDLENFCGYFKGIVNVGRASGCRFYYDTDDADIFLDLWVDLNPDTDGEGYAVLVSATGKNPTNFVIRSLHTTTPGLNTFNNALVVQNFTRFYAYDLYLEAAKNYGVVLDNVYLSEIESQYPIKVQLLNGSSVNLIKSVDDVQVTGNLLYNLIRIGRVTNYDSFSPTIGTGNVYGDACVRGVDTGARMGWRDIKNIIIVLSSIGTETITVKIETIDVTGTKNTVEVSYDSDGTKEAPFDTVRALKFAYTDIRKINVYAKTNQPSTSATVTVYIYG